MEQSCSAYIQNNGEIYLSAFDRSDDGPLVISGYWTHIPAHPSDHVLFEAVLDCLEKCGSISEEEFNNENLTAEKFKTFLTAIGVKSQKELFRKFRSLGIRRINNEIEITPTRRDDIFLYLPELASTVRLEAAGFAAMFDSQLQKCL